MLVAFDVGGTFTDIVCLAEDGHVTRAKVLSLLDHIGNDVIEQVRSAQPSTARVDRFVHGTTICSNALIAGRTARTAVVTTAGFRDTLELRAQKGPALPTVTWEPPRSLVPRDLCFEIGERILADGTVHAPLDVAQTSAIVGRLRDEGVEAVAVCLLNSYRNPAHEQQLGAFISGALPEVVVCLSSDVHPEIREYERTSTTVINAALTPVVRNYLDRLESELAPLGPDLVIMQSNGGIMSTRTARDRPMYMMESGPAAGVLGAARLATELGLPKVISFDMGGTTAKAALLQDGKPLERPGGEVRASGGIASGPGDSGHALRVSMIDLVEVGAGGGSIASVEDGVLRVGPRSAGAVPGPIAYSRGGTDVTVTDANIVLGYINPRSIADGMLALDADAAERALDAVAEQLGLSRDEAAFGVVQIANAVMMRSLRTVSVERGHDPREFVMIAFGGAGPLHAATLAERLGMSTVIIPPFPGVYSALGLLLADYHADYVRSVAAAFESIDAAELRKVISELQDVARHDATQFSLPLDNLEFEVVLDVRYAHQVEELVLPFPDVPDGQLVAALTGAFDQLHQHEFGYVAEGRRVLTNVRLRAAAAVGEHSFAALRGGRGSRAGGPDFRRAYFGPEHGTVDARVLTRSELSSTGIEGPAVIDEADTTVVVPPGWSASRHATDGLILRRL